MRNSTSSIGVYLYRHLLFTLSILFLIPIIFFVFNLKVEAATVKEDWPGYGKQILVGESYNYYIGHVIETSDHGAVILYDTPYGDLHAKKIDVNGNQVWGTDGILLDDQFSGVFRLMNDGNDGFIVLYQVGGGYDNNGELLIKRYDANGLLDWNISLSGNGFNDIIINESGEFILIYDKYSVADSAQNVYALKFNLSGYLYWGHGVNISMLNRSNDIESPVVVSDGNGGAIVSWADGRRDTTTGNYKDMIVQRVNSAGRLIWGGEPGTVINHPEVVNTTEYVAPTDERSSTFSYTVASGSNSILALVASYNDGYPWDMVDSDQLSTVTYNGESFTRVCKSKLSDMASEVWYLTSPDVGTANIQVNFANNMAVSATYKVIQIDNVNLTSPIASTTCQSYDDTTSIVLNKQTRYNSLLLTNVAAQNSYSFDGVYGGTNLWQNTLNTYVNTSGAYTIGEGSSVTMTWTANSTEANVALTAVEFMSSDDDGSEQGTYIKPSIYNNNSTTASGVNYVDLNTITVASGYDDTTFIAALVSYRSSSESVSSMVWGETSLTKGCSIRANEYTTELWYLNNPSANEATLTANFSNSVDDIVLAASSFTGVQTSDPIYSSACENNGGTWSTTPTITLNSGPDKIMWGGVTTYVGGNELTAGSSVSPEQWNTYSNNTLSAGGASTGNSIATLEWTGLQSWPWSSGALVLNGFYEPPADPAVHGSGQVITNMESYEYPYHYLILPQTILRDPSGNYYYVIGSMFRYHSYTNYHDNVRYVIQKIDTSGNVIWDTPTGNGVYFYEGGNEGGYPMELGEAYILGDKIYITLLGQNGTENAKQQIIDFNGNLTYSTSGTLVGTNGGKSAISKEKSATGLIPDGDSGAFIRLWSNGSTLYAQRYDSAGNSLLSENLVVSSWLSNEVNYSPNPIGIGDWGVYVIHVETRYNPSEIYDIYLQSVHTYYQIDGLPSNLEPTDVDLESIELGSTNGLRGEDQPVRLIDNNTGLVLTEVPVDFTEDRTWNNVTGESDLSTARSVVYNVVNAEGAASTHTLYIPKRAEDTSVMICPNAQTLDDVNTDCSDGYTLDLSSPSVSLVTVEGQEYWAISGMTGTGGLGIGSGGTPNMRVDLTNEAMSATDDIQVWFDTPTNISANSYIYLIFESVFTGGGSITTSDIDVNCDEDGLNGGTSTGMTTVTISDAKSGYIALDTNTDTCSNWIEVNINGGGGNHLTNPGSSGNYSWAVVTDVGGNGTDDDSGATLAYVGNDNDVNVTATVAPVIDMELFQTGTDTEMTDPNTCALGVLSLNTINTCSYDLGTGTNNPTGISVYVQSDGGLNDAYGDTIDNPIGAVVPGMEGYGFYVRDNGGGEYLIAGIYAAPHQEVPTSRTLLASTSSTGSGTTVGSSIQHIEIEHAASMSVSTVVGTYNQLVTYTAFTN